MKKILIIILKIFQQLDIKENEIIIIIQVNEVKNMNYLILLLYLQHIALVAIKKLKIKIMDF
ncbi:ORF MSV083 hypothetical protein [Melanoplus sanguinipes entomopoxvirus]|uniref:Uncharacterized protein n=1 Tax=Melanoplus sanguinipes entomopoxvirus TaxID=83191 RepID=Q9YW09_MSEPV|nr:ORF MSV083 hypothetical protein [Melanoplus sanguinipes entomopoxvirus]AAC97636.1 ORF MSV083 hypothetical protein [Melanoplus sanguinipes entomopoxvirus 'O']